MLSKNDLTDRGPDHDAWTADIDLIFGNASTGKRERTGAEQEDFHKMYLRRHEKLCPEVASLLPADCLRVLERRGAWLAALADGTLRPLDAAQEQFVRVANWKAESRTLDERSWCAYYVARLALLMTPRPSLRTSIREWLADAAGGQQSLGGDPVGKQDRRRRSSTRIAIRTINRNGNKSCQ